MRSFLSFGLKRYKIHFDFLLFNLIPSFSLSVCPLSKRHSHTLPMKMNLFPDSIYSILPFFHVIYISITIRNYVNEILSVYAWLSFRIH